MEMVFGNYFPECWSFDDNFAVRQSYATTLSIFGQLTSLMGVSGLFLHIGHKGVNKVNVKELFGHSQNSQR